METINKKGVLVLCPFYSPNIGGVETHLLDLVKAISTNNLNAYVLTYTPLTTPNTSYQLTEKKQNIYIKRFPWIGKNIFHTFERFPLFDFLYLTPYLLICSCVWLLFNQNKIKVIHSHGINAAFIGNILSRLFKIKHITSTHAIYEHISGISRQITVSTLNNTSTVLCLSKKSLSQLKSWGVSENKLHLYRYWINLSLFKPSKIVPKNFTVLYVGRLIDKKGIPELLTAATKLPSIKFVIAGNGPSSDLVKKYRAKYSNIEYLGPISYQKLPKIYQNSSLFCIPSQYPEGYGRVVMEAVGCGIPIIGSNFGSIGEAVDESVSILFRPTSGNIIKAIRTLRSDKTYYNMLKSNCRKYALKHFGSKNYQLIANFY